MLAFSVPTQVDGVGVDVDVHQVIDYLTLDVVLHPVDQETASDINDLDEGQVPEGWREKIRDNQKYQHKQKLKDQQGTSCSFCVV